MRKSKFSPEVVERAIRMVFDAKDQYPSQWSAIESIATKIGCTPETLRRWVRQTDFVLDALEQALYARRGERDGDLVHHSDRGFRARTSPRTTPTALPGGRAPSRCT